MSTTHDMHDIIEFNPVFLVIVASHIRPRSMINASFTSKLRISVKDCDHRSQPDVWGNNDRKHRINPLNITGIGIMSKSLNLWRTFWHHDIKKWRHNELFDVMMNFLSSWLDDIFVVIMTYFWLHDERLTYCWRHDKPFNIMTCFLLQDHW